jgi:hypothetical protein
MATVKRHLRRVPWEVWAVLTLIVLDGAAVIATQVVKRGWTNHEVPSLILPAANWGWPVVLAGAFVVWRFWFRQPSRTTRLEASPAISSSA